MIGWDKLPKKFHNDKVKEYYEILSKRKGSMIVKRVFDIAGSIVLLVILSPVFGVLAIWIKADSEGPVFYRQERITQYGKPFKIYKFRTMVQNADKIGSLVTVGNDSRITKVGEKIRKVRLDEIPQLINVLKGEMSFVGTRPEVKKYVDCYTDEMMATLLMPAGVTSLASIKFKDEDEIMSMHTEAGMDADTAYVKYVLPEKMKYNLEYLKDFSFFGDIRLMWKTLVSVI